MLEIKKNAGSGTLASRQALQGRNALLVDESNKKDGHSVSRMDRSRFSHCGYIRWAVDGGRQSMDINDTQREVVSTES